MVVGDPHNLEFKKLTIEYGQNFLSFRLFSMVNFYLLYEYVG